jgi:Arm DNA-binding domain
VYLVIGKDGSKKWVFMYARDGKRREAGLGSARAVTLAQAREKAAEYRALLVKGIAGSQESRP